MTEEEIMQALPEFSLQIQGDDTHPVISNFDDLKEWVNKAVDYAKGQITSTDAKDLKPVRAQLNKLYEKLEDARKNLKRRLEAPYKEWEIQYKDAVSSLLGASDEIGTLIKTQETRERDMRPAGIYFNILYCYNITNYKKTRTPKRYQKCYQNSCTYRIYAHIKRIICHVEIYNSSN